MTVDEFQEVFGQVRAMGWVPSQRKGSTGVGHTLERLLSLKENNIASPDLGAIELKARRSHSGSMVTLFTFNRKVWRMKPIEAIRKYGTPGTDGRLGLYFTMSPTPNGSGLFVRVESETISVRHIDGTLIAEWQLEQLANRFMQKIPSVILVSASSEMRGDIEWFRYERAQLLAGTSAEIIRSQITAGNIRIDLRLHDNGRSARNHGTGFRAFEDNLPQLFAIVKDIEIVKEEEVAEEIKRL